MLGFSMPKVPEVDADEVVKAIQEKKEFLLIDVRTQGEYEKGRIEGSINIPLEEIEAKINELTSDKNKLIYVYCLSGSRSTYAVYIMQKLGYKNAFSMTSGILAWRVKNYPMINQ